MNNISPIHMSVETEAGTEPRDGGSRIVIDELTGLPVMVFPPGTPYLTCRRVNELLEDFP
jgi:hypothetical protein